MNCCELEELAAEPALGTVSGPERAVALDHRRRGSPRGRAGRGGRGRTGPRRQLRPARRPRHAAHGVDLPLDHLRSVRVLDGGRRVRYEVPFPST